MLPPNLAMSAGSEYNPNLIHRSHFIAMAKDLEIKPTMVEKIIDEMSAKITAALPQYNANFVSNILTNLTA